jgi:hypothetical protein
MKSIVCGIVLSLATIALANAENLKIDAKSWNEFNHVGSVKVEHDYFSARITGIDPWIMSKTISPVDASKIKYIKFELQMPAGIAKKGQIFWKTVENNNFSGVRYFNFTLNSDGKWHVYKIPVFKIKKWTGKITGIRFDPAVTPEKLEIFKLRNFELVKEGKDSIKLNRQVKIMLKTASSKPVTGPYPKNLFNPAGALLVNGKPTFILHSGDLPVVDDPFAGLAAAGFNLITFAGISKGIIDVLEKNNLKVMLSVRYNKSQTEKSFGEKVRRLYNKYPRLNKIVASYYAADEPVWVGMPLKSMMEAYKFYKTFTPRRPVFINHAPRNSIGILKKYNAGGDITGVDIYPVPDGNHSDLPNKTISCVGDYTDKMLKTALPGQPVWIYLQAYARAKKIPTYHETRFMAYDAIMHGAMGLCYYGLRHLKWPNKMWPQLQRFGPEIRSLNEVLVAPWNSRLIKKNGIEIRYKIIDGKLVVFASNNTAQKLELKFSLDRDTDKLHVLFEDRNIVRKGNCFSDTFKPYDVHIYSEKMIKKLKLKKQAVSGMKWITKSEGHWIWDKQAQRKNNAVVYFRRIFEVGALPENAGITITADDNYRLYCNGKLVGEDVNSSQGGWKTAEYYNLKPFLKAKSQNIIAVEGINNSSMAGLWAEIKIGNEIIYTDELWRTSSKKQAGWRGEISDENWNSATSYGMPPCNPWNSFLRPVK